MQNDIIKKMGVKSDYILVKKFSCAHPYDCIIKLLNKMLKYNPSVKKAIFGVRHIFVKSNNF